MISSVILTNKLNRKTMNKRAEEYLKIALGGNMNIATLKPLALIEIMTDFAKKEVEAINYTRCCDKLKDGKRPNIEEWLEINKYYRKGQTWFNKYGYNRDYDFLIRIYNEEMLNL